MCVCFFFSCWFFLLYQGDSFCLKYDPNSLLYISKVTIIGHCASHPLLVMRHIPSDTQLNVTAVQSMIFFP